MQGVKSPPCRLAIKEKHNTLFYTRTSKVLVGCKVIAKCQERKHHWLSLVVLPTTQEKWLKLPFLMTWVFYMAMKRTFVVMLSRITKRPCPQEIVYDSISREFPNRWISNARFDQGFKEIRGNK